MLNKIILKGNLGRDPEIKLTQHGRKIATFTLVTSFSWKDAEGEWQTHADWHPIIIFRDSTIRWIDGMLKKGDLVYVEGKISYSAWVDKYQQKRISPHIVIDEGHGRLEYLRASKSSLAEATSESQDKALDTKESLQLEDTLQASTQVGNIQELSSLSLHSPSSPQQ